MPESPDISQKTKTKKFMMFTLGSDRYATQLSMVKEVIGLAQITKVPNVPRYFRGLINLRGKIISVMDLRERLNIPLKEESRRPCIIIAEIQGLTLGAIVDDVLEVLGIEDSQLDRQIDIGANSTRDYIVGAIRYEGKPLSLILDLAKVMDAETLASLRSQSELTQSV